MNQRNRPSILQAHLQIQIPAREERNFKKCPTVLVDIEHEN